MDEFPEFERRSLDALRQPLEDKIVTVSRVQGTARFPANFVLIAAMNPYRSSEDGTTDLARAMKETYKNKVSGPILDRIDLWIEVPHVDYQTLGSAKSTEGETELARSQVAAARIKMTRRFPNQPATTNADMSSRELDKVIELTKEVTALLQTSATKLNLSPRSYHRLIKVARTIADLEGADTLSTEHVLEALQYRVRL